MPFLPILKVDSEKIPERVLVVGDPGRLDRISGKLSEATVIAENREYKTMLGLFDGTQIGVISHGVGSAGAGVCFEEICKSSAKKIIRIGTAGGMQKGIGAGKIIVAKGHSPEHACLYSEKKNIFICGDILLPRITPNVSVNPANPDSNPLRDWLESLEKIKQSIPHDVLVLPSHGYPYQGAHRRIETIVNNHHEKLERRPNYMYWIL